MPSPLTMWSASRMRSMPGNRRDVAADDDLRVRGVLAHQPAHLAHLPHVDDDAGDADHVVLPAGQLADEARPGREVEQRRRRRDVVLDELDAPRSVEHAERERPLLAGHLVLVQLHRVDGPAAVLIVDRVGPEDRRQQHARAGALGVWFHQSLAHSFQRPDQRRQSPRDTCWGGQRRTVGESRHVRRVRTTLIREGPSTNSAEPSRTAARGS